MKLDEAKARVESLEKRFKLLKVFGSIIDTMLFTIILSLVIGILAFLNKVEVMGIMNCSEYGMKYVTASMEKNKYYIICADDKNNNYLSVKE